LARDTGWSVDACADARDWLVEHEVIEKVGEYIRPDWRKLPDQEKAQKRNLDKSEYYRLTGKLTADNRTYDLLYFGGHEGEQSDVGRQPTSDAAQQRRQPTEPISSIERIATELEHSTNNTSADAPRSISTDKKLPKRTAKFTRAYIVAYAAQCGTNANLLVSAWYGVGSHSSVATLGNYDGQIFIETNEELERLSVGTDKYPDFVKYVKKVQNWKGRENPVKPSEMCKCITGFKDSIKQVNPAPQNKPLTEWEYDLANILEQQKREAELYGRA